MARNRGPRHKLARREGVNLTGTSSPSLQRRLRVPPGQARPHRRQSEYGIRLRAKQRVKRQYGMLERDFRRRFEQASRTPGNTGENLLFLLERRLDTVVYRLGFARTRPMARQLVNHRHILVNGRRVNIPSYRIQPGDIIQLTEKASEIPVVKEELAAPPARLPSWLTRENGIGRVIGDPQRGEIDPDIREDLIVEFYSR
jgi:small subunit ribosomal protein S4